jgi:hypothetical protein
MQMLQEKKPRYLHVLYNTSIGLVMEKCTMSKLKLFLKGISGVRTMCAMFFAKQGQDDSGVHEVLGEVRSGQMMQYRPSRNGKENLLGAFWQTHVENIKDANGTWMIQRSFNYHHCLIISSSFSTPLSSQQIVVCCQACRNSI